MRWQAVGIASLAVLCSFCVCEVKKRSSQLINLHYYAIDQSNPECECGKPNLSPSARIVGGTLVHPHEYPWLAQLLYNGTFLCGGTLISDLHVISAGHCLIKGLKQDLLKIRLGEHNMCKADITTSTFSVTKIVRHNKFNMTSFDADILLLKLNMRINFDKYVKPICLPPYSHNANSESRYKSKHALVLGWGKTFYGNTKPSCEPHKLKIPVLERRLCGGPVASSLFCAGYLNGEGDACQGDSGGPLQYKNHLNRYELIGIVSNGIGCALPGKPGLYTDVLRFLPWIIKHATESNFCY